MTIEKNPRATKKFYKNLFLPVVTWNKKVFIELSYSNNKHTGENVFFADSTFEGL